MSYLRSNLTSSRSLLGPLYQPSAMTLEQGKAYIQKNPLFGRKVVLFERIRESVWDWNLCDVSIVSIDKVPEIYHLQGAASSIFDHQGLEEIPTKVFDKIHAMVKVLHALQSAVDEPQVVALRQETLDRIIELLTHEGIINDDTYSPTRLKAYSDEYDRYSRLQMEQVTDVIDVHK